MKKLLLFILLFVSYNTYSNTTECHDRGRKSKGVNYKKLHKSQRKHKKRNTYGCANYTFKK